MRSAPGSPTSAVSGQTPPEPACDALVLHQHDNVATALRPLPRGTAAQLAGTGTGAAVVVLREPIALCHKFALRDLEQGSVIVKYGESIGRASRVIRAGEHVHTHNLKSSRAG